MKENFIDKLNETKRLINSLINNNVNMLFSGGKESCVVKYLLEEANINVKYFYISTGMEGSLLIDFIKKYHNDVIILEPEKDVFDVIREVGYMPTIKNLFCCHKYRKQMYDQIFLENKICVTGFRKDDKANNWVKESFYRDRSVAGIVSPIFNWDLDDVMNFISENNIPISHEYEYFNNKSYSCPLCPMMGQSGRMKSVEIYPEISNKLKMLSYELWENNQTLQNEYKTAEDYWNYFINQDMNFAKKRWEENMKKTVEEYDGLYYSLETDSVVM